MVEDEASLSPQHQMAASAPAAAELDEPAPPLGVNGFGMPEKRHEPTLDAGWRSAPPPAALAQTR